MFESLKAKIASVLRRSEAYTKTDMVYLFRGGILNTVAEISTLGSTLVLAIIIGRFLPQDVYGIYKYILSIIAILSLFSLSSIGDAVFQSAAEGFDGAVRKAFWDNIRWSGVVFVGALVIALYYFLVGNSTLAGGVLIGGALSPFLASGNLYLSFLAAKKDFWRQTIYGIFDNVIPVLLLIVTVLLTSNPVILIAVYFVSNTLAGLYFYRRTVQVYRISMDLQDKKMIPYTKHLSVMGIISGIASNLDQILLFHFAGAAQVAIYNFATAIPDQVKVPIKNIGAMLQPRLVERTGVSVQRGMWNKVFWYTLACVVFIAVYIALAPLFFRILFPQYVDSVWYSQIYVFWILSFGLDPMTTYMVSRRLVAEQYVTNIVSSVLQITGMVIGVIFWGILGLVVAKVIVRLLLAGLTYILYRRAIAREIVGTT